MNSRLLTCMFLCAFLIPSMTQNASAWNQGTHRQINHEAVNLFLSQMQNKEKYSLSPITRDLRNEPYRGIAVDSSCLYVKDYQLTLGNYTMAQWIVLGGDWADEPHLYASLRHFYDPLGRVEHYLTDGWIVHGVLYESPEIDARTWALDHPDNPFSFKQGLVYYKLAMEVDDERPLPPMLSQSHFKLNLNLVPVDHADQRRTYLALAYRALGESMHMLADMTQPAHVRNDAHALDEPIESRVFSEHVRSAARDPLLDPRLTPFLAGAGGTQQKPEALFHRVATFINENFYSADTIYDQPSHVIPNHYDRFLALPYPSPQFADLQERYTRVQGYLIQRRVKRYEGKGGAFDWMLMTMAQERLSFHWFDPDQSVLVDPLESAGRLLGKHGRYHIPNAYAPDQAKVLLPIAIYANADLMDMFFPTLELKATYTDEGIQQGNAPGRNNYSRNVIRIDAEMEHYQARDKAWSDYELLVEYTGAAKLVISEEDNAVKTRELYFRNGKLDKIEMPDGSLERRDLQLYAPLAGEALTEEEEFYRIENLQSVHIEIKAGTRHFQSESFLFESEEATVTILPPRIVTYELQRGATRVTHNFEAVGRPEATYRFTWKFGDGNTFTEIVQPGATSRASHTYYNLNAGDRFYPEVTLETVDRVFLAVDSMTINITQASDSGQGSTTSGTFRPSDDLPWISYTITGAGDTSYVDSPESDKWWEANQRTRTFTGMMDGEALTISGTVYVPLPSGPSVREAYLDVRAWSQTEQRYEKRFMPGTLENFNISVPVAQGQRAQFYIHVSPSINKSTRVDGSFN
ncbi:PKD domain-containing protein [Desulfatitalea alkaliphila]|uniref:PKD domain-containing protein n=1 Tax=Desulfatitalea alkaliphila TaxID=2929485 RepID=A0AA41UL96_9BACT|nr:hypothetical protein [Desulfatitalea alkaliphila]MCJ8501256.1 hypothetical protein [Desulfatitalea alkaliphila]